MTAPVPDPLPYGVRQIMLTPYLDTQGTVLSTQSYPLPVAMTLGFAETEQFDELRGDDKLQAVHGRGPQVDWSLESGGMNMVAWSIITGGSVTVSGVAPNRQVILAKSWDNQRPYFRIDGRMISDSGGNVVARIYRAKANGKIQANNKNGAFQTSQIDGIGLPLHNDDASWLYEIIQNETDSALTGTPQANPVPVPSNLFVAAVGNTSVALTWTNILQASGYLVKQSIDGGNTFQSIAAGTNAVQTLAIPGSFGTTFTLTWNSQTTAAINVGATAQQVQAAFQALSGVGAGNVVVSGSIGGPYLFTFVGALANAPQNTITATGSNGVASVQTATITGGPTGGTFTLTFASQTTSALAYNSTAAQVQSALQALSSIGVGNVTVSGPAGGPYVITFAGTLAPGPQSAITATPSLTGGTSPGVTITQTTTGVANSTASSATTTTGVNGGGAPVGPATVIDGLTANTSYQFEVAAVVNGVTGSYCTPVQVVTT